jgi:hypothetical protein
VNGADKARKNGRFARERLLNIFPSHTHSKFDIAFQYYVRSEM